MITAKIKFGIVCRCGFSCFQWCFWCYELYLTCSRWCSPKRRCCFVGSVWCYAKPRCYYSFPYCVMRNLDAIIRVCMVLCKTSIVRKLSSEHLEQPTSPNLDSLIPITRNQFFYCVETLYNTVLSVRWDNIIIYAVAKWSASGQGFLTLIKCLAVSYFSQI